MEKTDFIQEGEEGTVHVLNPHKANEDSTDNILLAAGGAFLSVLGLQKGGILGIAAALTGGAFIYRSILGKWPGNGDVLSGENASVDISTSLVIKQPREMLYSYWRNLHNLPNFMKHLKDVTELDEKHSHWIARIPGGLGEIEWDAQIIQEEEDSLLAWRSLPGAEIHNSGEVRFEDALNGTATRVETRISYRPPAGEIGELAAKALNPAFKKVVENDLKHFKEFMELGSYDDEEYDLWQGSDPLHF